MSKFFKALEQAERDRALLKQAERREEDGPAEIVSKAQTAEREEGPSAGSPARMENACLDIAPDLMTSEQFRHLEPEAASGPARGILDRVDQRLVSLLNPNSFEAEQYRTLRHIVEQLHKNTDLCMVAISSPAVGDGKTTTAINLAGSLAQGPKDRVLLVEADLRRPSIIDYLGLGYLSGKGLVDAILEPSVSLDDVVAMCPPYHMAVLPAGRIPASSYELLKSPRLEELLKELRRRYDYVVLDAPPVIPLPDCRLIGKSVDGFLLVVAAHKTPRKLLEEALNVLDPTKVLGLVFNSDDRPVAGYYYRHDQPTNGHWKGLLGRMGTVTDLLGLRR